MERVMSVEEKIRRAEEIYQKRRQGEVRPIAKVAINEKKDIKLLRKMILQIIICITIYLVVYMIQNNQYVFSEDFINKANEILSYDTNFVEIYEMIKNQVMGFMNQKKAEEGENEGQPEIENGQEQQPQTDENAGINTEAIGGAEGTKELTPEEQDIQTIKNTASFIKPIEGEITSAYGVRENATGSVPKNHTGTDIAANVGTKIKSATEGEVVLASEEGDYRKAFKNPDWRS